MPTRFLAGLPFIQEALTAFNQNDDALLEESFFWMFVAVCIVGSVVEELVFRGLIYNALARAFRSPVPAITISGLAFGIWHGNLIQSVYTAIMGMIIAFVYYKTKKLVFPILLHMLNNLISTPLPAIQDTVIADMINYGCIIMIIPFIVLFYRVFFRKDGAGVQAV